MPTPRSASAEAFREVGILLCRAFLREATPVGKKKKLYNQIIAMLNDMRRRLPTPNPAQDILTQQAIQGANYLKGRDYRNLSQAPGVFFDFQAPADQRRQYETMANASQTGTFALADNAGRSKATALAGDYLRDKFARDAAVNYQGNIMNAGNMIRGALGQSSDAAARAAAMDDQRRQAILNSLTSMYNAQASRPSIWGQILGTAGQVGSAAIGAFA